jgi:hypothetical protein
MLCKQFLNFLPVTTQCSVLPAVFSYRVLNWGGRGGSEWNNQCIFRKHPQRKRSQLNNEFSFKQKLRIATVVSGFFIWTKSRTRKMVEGAEWAVHLWPKANKNVTASTGHLARTPELRKQLFKLCHLIFIIILGTQSIIITSTLLLQDLNHNYRPNTNHMLHGSRPEHQHSVY